MHFIHCFFKSAFKQWCIYAHRSKNQPEKWSHLFLYLLETKKYPEMFLVPFYAAGPFGLDLTKPDKVLLHNLQEDYFSTNASILCFIFYAQLRTCWKRKKEKNRKKHYCNSARTMYMFASKRIVAIFVCIYLFYYSLTYLHSMYVLEILLNKNS